MLLHALVSLCSAFFFFFKLSVADLTEGSMHQLQFVLSWLPECEAELNVRSSPQYNHYLYPLCRVK